MDFNNMFVSKPEPELTPEVRYAGLPRPIEGETIEAYIVRSGVKCECEANTQDPEEDHDFETCPMTSAMMVWAVGPAEWDLLHSQVKVQGWSQGG